MRSYVPYVITFIIPVLKFLFINLLFTIAGVLSSDFFGLDVRYASQPPTQSAPRGLLNKPEDYMLRFSENSAMERSRKYASIIIPP